MVAECEKLEINLLGPFQVLWQGTSITDFPTDKIRALLAYLAVERNQPHRRDSLAVLLWSEHDDKTARRNLRQSLHRLKQTLGKYAPGLSDQLLQVSRQTIALDQTYVKIDVSTFTEVLASSSQPSQQPHTAEVTQTLVEAAALYRGELLTGLNVEEQGFDEWLQFQRQHYHLQYYSLLQTLTKTFQQAGSWEASEEYARRWLHLEPWNEEAHRALMRILWQSGQRSAALAQYDICCDLLDQELGVDPEEETQALYEAIQQGQYSTTTEAVPLMAAPSLPQLPAPSTPFVGRQKELNELLHILQSQEHRLVSVLGPGGTGKTRLTLEVSRMLANDPTSPFPDGIFFVPFVALEEEQQVPVALAQCLGLPVLSSNQSLRDSLIQFLKGKRLLLVCDLTDVNTEGMSFLSELLETAPHLSILVATRVALGLQTEVRYSISGLTLDEAVDLFVRRAVALRPEFSVDPARDEISSIVTVAGGSPLAIELAASWIRVLDVPEILSELQQDIDFLQSDWSDLPERHRSMRRVFESAWNLLNPAEQQLLANLSIFRGSCSLQAARQVAQASLPHLARLLDHSLLQRNEAGRYSVHDLLRQFSSEKLSQSSKQEGLVRQHCQFFLYLPAQQAPALLRDSPQKAQSIIQQDWDNIRKAWRTAASLQMFDELETAMEGLFTYCEQKGLYQEALFLLSEVFHRLSIPTNAPSLLKASLAAWIAWFHSLTGEVEQAQFFVANAEQALSGTPSPWLQAFLKRIQAQVHISLGEYDQALQGFRQVLELAQTSHDIRNLSDAHSQIAHIQWRRGEYDEALKHLKLGVERAKAAGYQAGVIRHQVWMGILLRDRGDLTAAITEQKAALEVARTYGLQVEIARCLNNLGVLEKAAGLYDDAISHYEEGLRISETLGLQSFSASFLLNLGVVYYYLGRFPNALDVMNQVLHLYNVLGEHSKIGLVLANMGNIYAAMGQFDEAKRRLHEAIAHEKEVGHTRELARTLGNMGELSIRQEQWDQALSYFEEGIALLRDVDHSFHLCWELIECARVYLHLHRLEDARAAWKEGFTIAQQIERADVVFSAQLVKAQLDAATGDVTQATTALQTLQQDNTLDPEQRAHIAYTLWTVQPTPDTAQQALQQCRKAYAWRADIAWRKKIEEIEAIKG